MRRQCTVGPGSAYLANLTAWTQADFGVSYVNGSSPTTATPSPSPTSTICMGNQVEGNCTGAVLPSSTPYSRNLGPSCAKADGASGSGPRLNATLADKAASEYCNNLVNAKVVLSNSTDNPKPGSLANQAENGATMALYVMYDIDSCPQDKSNSTLDFSTMGVDACFKYLYSAISEDCSQDPTWGDYNKDWTMEGGVFGTSCGLFSMVGQSA